MVDLIHSIRCVWSHVRRDVDGGFETRRHDRDGHDVSHGEHVVSHGDHDFPSGDHDAVGRDVHVCVLRDGLERACFRGFDEEQRFEMNKHDRDHGRDGDGFAQQLL